MKALTKRLDQKIRMLEQEIEDNRMAMQKKEKESQKEVDILRSNYLKIESEKTLKEKEITEIREEVTTIRNQIMQVNCIFVKDYIFIIEIFTL